MSKVERPLKHCAECGKLKLISVPGSWTLGYAKGFDGQVVVDTAGVPHAFCKCADNIWGL